MGADIHLVLERKFNGKWVGVQEAGSRFSYAQNETTKEWKKYHLWDRSRARNYDLFARLASVRGEGAAPKGVPEDASELSRALIEEIDVDGHSHSFCTLAEYIEALVATHYNPAEVFLVGHPAVGDPHGYFFGRYEPEEDEEYRVVFWFDN